MKDLVNDLFLNNPMLAEYRFMARRVLGGTQNRTVTVVILVVVVGLLSVVGFTYPAFMAPISTLNIQLFLFCLLSPGLTAGLFAAEREKRTWELLRVAPLTIGQLIVGKVVGPLMVLLTMAGMLVVPTIASLIGRAFEVTRGGGLGGYPETTFLAYLNGQAITLSFGLLLLGVGALFSARSSRMLTASLATYGFLAFVLIAYPILASLVGNASGDMDGRLVLYPFYALYTAIDVNAAQYRPEMVILFAVSRGLTPWIYVVLAGVALFMAHRALSRDQKTDRGPSRETHA